MNLENIFTLKNKTIIVTGALGLIGKRFCKSLDIAGANVVVADLNEHLCIEFSTTMENSSIGISVDITDKDSVLRLKELTMERFGHIDVLVNNAAINDMVENPASIREQSKFENYPIDLFRKVIDVNVTGMFLCSQIIGSVMADQKSGSIINIASTYGIVGPDQSIYRDMDGNQKFYKSPSYPASKGAVINFTRFLASYWGEKNVRVNCLSPGGVENNQDETFIMKYSQKTPLGRMAQADDYDGAIIFLASDASKYMTGANLVIDGGWTCI